MLVRCEMYPHSFLKETCETIEPHIIIRNERIVIKQPIFYSGPLYKPFFHNSKEIFFTFLRGHLAVKLPQEEYRPQLFMSMSNENMVPHLMEFQIKYFQAVSAKESLLHKLRDLEIKQEYVTLTKEIKPRSYPNPEVADINVDKHYAYLYLSPNQSVPIINCEILQTRLINRHIHCTACGSNFHTR